MKNFSLAVFLALIAIHVGAEMIMISDGNAHNNNPFKRNAGHVQHTQGLSNEEKRNMPGYECKGNGNCKPICGDGILTSEEEQNGDCDDGNDVKGDGCYQCQPEKDWECNEKTESGKSKCSRVFLWIEKTRSDKRSDSESTSSSSSESDTESESESSDDSSEPNDPPQIPCGNGLLDEG